MILCFPVARSVSFLLLRFLFSELYRISFSTRVNITKQIAFEKYKFKPAKIPRSTKTTNTDKFTKASASSLQVFSYAENEDFYFPG